MHRIAESRPSVSIARINGLVHVNDNQAVMSLADQLLLRPSNFDRNINIAHEGDGPYLFRTLTCLIGLFLSNSSLALLIHLP